MLLTLFLTFSQIGIVGGFVISQRHVPFLAGGTKGTMNLQRGNAF